MSHRQRLLSTGGDPHLGREPPGEAHFQDIALGFSHVGGNLLLTVAKIRRGRLRGQPLCWPEPLHARRPVFRAAQPCLPPCRVQSRHARGDGGENSICRAGWSAANSGSMAPGKPRWTLRDGEPGDLVLRNTHVGDLMDARDAWPTPGASRRSMASPSAILAASKASRGTEMRARGMSWWDNWARLDPKYTPTPYVQLAAALSKSGDPDDANEVRYLGRERERETLCADAWPLGSAGSCALSTALKWGAGRRDWILQFPRPLLARVLLAARRGDPLVFRAGRSPPSAGQTLVLRREPLAASARHRDQQGVHRVLPRPGTASGSQGGRASSFPPMS